jgi:hypothetical protein
VVVHALVDTSAALTTLPKVNTTSGTAPIEIRRADISPLGHFVKPTGGR